MFKIKGTIALKVMEAIEAKIQDAELEYTEECEHIDARAFQEKQDVANRIVGEIIK